MLDRDFIDDMVKRLSDALPPGLQAVKEEMERNFRSILQSTFAKLNLVTREEFDVQTAVLAKTRAKLEALEKQIADLEAQLVDKSTHNQ